MRVLLVGCLLLVLSSSVNGQRKVLTTNMFWLGYYNNISISNRWSANTDFQVRTRDWTNKFSQGLIRSGLTYKVRNNFSVTGGLAWFKNAEYVGSKLLLKTEFRPWQELALQSSFNNKKLSQRLRFEKRLMQQLQDGEKTNNYESISRLRYKIDFQFHLMSNLNCIVANEVMVHPGFVGTKRFFDQNRASGAINWKVSQPMSLQLQYMKIYQSRANATITEDQNVFRFIVYHQVNFKKQ